MSSLPLEPNRRATLAEQLPRRRASRATTMPLRSAGPAPPSPTSACLSSLPTPSATTSIPRLPLELLALVAQEAIATLVDEGSTKAPAELCLISKSLLPFSQAALYHIVYFSERGGSWENVLERCASGDRLLRTIEQAPHLARRIVRVGLSDDRFSASLATDEYIGRAVSLCPNLQGLLASGYRGWPIPLESILDLVQHFTCLRIGSLDSTHVHGREILSFSNMQDLVELQILDSQLEEPLPPPPPFQLEQLALEYIGLCGNRLSLKQTLDYLLTDSTTSLRRLILPGYLPLPSFARFTSLTSLELLVGPWERGPRHLQRPIPPPTLEILNSIAAACSSCHHLRSLRLSSGFHHHKLATLIEETGFLTRLPSTLQVLDLSLLPMSLAALLALLAEDVSPSLRRLHVHRLEDPEDQEKLQRKCWARGVDVYSSSKTVKSRR